MNDKSPRQRLSQKAGKSLKEKRLEKQAKAEAKARPHIIPPTKQDAREDPPGPRSRPPSCRSGT